MKRTVERVASPESDVPAEPPTASVERENAPIAEGRQPARRRAQALTDARGNKSAEERKFEEPIQDAHAQGRESLKEILARAEGGKGAGKPKEPTKAQIAAMQREADEPEVPPENDNPDPDANPPEEETEAPAEEETTAEGEGEAETSPAAASDGGKDGDVEYLTAEQRRELAGKLSENRRQRELEAELKRVQSEAEKLKSAKSVRELLEATGRDPAVALEELLVGGGTPAEPAADMSPRERELLTRVATLEKLIQDSQTNAQKQGRATYVQNLREKLTAEHFPMIAAMDAYESIYEEAELLYDGAQDDRKGWSGYGGRIAQVAADNVEQKLRAKYPAIAAKLGSPSDTPAAKPAPAPKPKPTVGSRSAPASRTAAGGGDDLPLDESRHVTVRERFFGRRHTA